MSRETWIWNKQRSAWVRKLRDKTYRLATANIIPDEMPPTWHPATGEMVTSKRGFRERTRAAGCVEIGNEPIRDQRRDLAGDPRPDIARAIEQLQNR